MKALTEQLKQLWSDEKRRVNLLVAMGPLGIALLAASSFFPKEQRRRANHFSRSKAPIPKNWNSVWNP